MLNIKSCDIEGIALKNSSRLTDNIRKDCKQVQFILKYKQ